MVNRKNIFPLLLIIPVLLTPFIYSDELYNGVISAKQIWFYGAMALFMAGTGLQMLFSRKPVTFGLNAIDIALLVFYTYQIAKAKTIAQQALSKKIKIESISIDEIKRQKYSN
jgi:hypothetical protein